MYRIVFSFFLGFIFILMSSLPLFVHADWKARQGEAIRRQEGKAGLDGRQGLEFGRYQVYQGYPDYQGNAARYYGQYGPNYGNYGYPNTLYDSYYGSYGNNYPSYSSYSTYPVYPNNYIYSDYRGYYYNPGMYNPNTTFVNPPSSLNDPYRYPGYSENYIYR